VVCTLGAAAALCNSVESCVLQSVGVLQHVLVCCSGLQRAAACDGVCQFAVVCMFEFCTFDYI